MGSLGIGSLCIQLSLEAAKVAYVRLSNGRVVKAELHLDMLGVELKLSILRRSLVLLEAYIPGIGHNLQAPESLKVWFLGISSLEHLQDIAPSFSVLYSQQKSRRPAAGPGSLRRHGQRWQTEGCAWSRLHILHAVSTPGF